MTDQATYVCYKESGQITAIVKGPRDVIEEPLGLFVDYQGWDEIGANYYVSDGEIVQKPIRPSTSYIFDYPSKDWVLDLGVAKQNKWNEIKGFREAQEFGTFDWGGYTFQCNDVSQRRIQGAVQLAMLDSTLTLDWTLADNTVQTFNASEFEAIGQALAAHVSACHVKARTLRAEIDAATSEEQIAAVTW